MASSSLNVVPFMTSPVHPRARSFSVPQLRRAISTLDLSESNPHKLTNSSILLKACIRSGNLDLGKHLHHKLLHSRLDLDSVLLNSLITIYSKSGDWQNALSIFHDMGDKRDLVSWCAIISCFSNNTMESRALVTFLHMLNSGIYPNQFCFTPLIRSCSNAQYYSVGRALFGFVLKTGYFDSHACVGNALIDMFTEGGRDIESARMVFGKMPEKDEVTWTLMITRFVQLGLLGDAVHLFCSMLESEYAPDRFILTRLLSACVEMEFFSLGKQLHSWFIKSGLASDVCMASTLVDMYAKSAADGSLENSRKIFNSMPCHDVVSWTALISGYVQGRQEQEAIILFCNMLHDHVAPNCFTFSSLLKASANLPDFGLGKQLHGQTIKLGLSAINSVGISLNSMYARFGRLECARKALNILSEKNFISCNTAVGANAKELDSEESINHEIELTGMPQLYNGLYD